MYNILSRTGSLGTMLTIVLMVSWPQVVQSQMLAQKPPMGWNSWNCMGFEIREHHVREIADYMAENLLEHGYEYLVLDAGWYYPPHVTTNMGHLKNPEQSIDLYGRLIPDTLKFPSSINGEGFKPLADYIHSKGLKFGIHVMRGIPWNAHELNTPVLGSNQTARDMAMLDKLCEWNHSMYGLNCETAEGKAYYQSIVDLYKEWGVDFIKIDDISRPINKPEIKAFSEAVRSCGRDMVISLSPGASPVDEAEFLGQYANMWRISNDIWDTWRLIRGNFDYCSKWYQHSKPGAWPDADMLPIGKLRITGADDWVAGLLGAKYGEIENEFSRLTHDEQYTVMNLWSVFRSPLMIGSYLTMNDEFSNSLLTNTDLIELNQQSTGNREVYRTDELSIWTASHQTRPLNYLAVFNLSDLPAELVIDSKMVGMELKGLIVDLWSKKEISNQDGTIKVTLKPHQSVVFSLGR
jgi:alpha-galactosidase